MIERIIEFVCVFVFCYLVYLFGIMLRKKRNKFNPKKLKVEETYLISKYNIDMKKVNYKRHLNLIAISNSLIFAITLEVVTITDRLLWQLLFSIAVLVPLIVLTYSIIGKYYIKKGYKVDAKVIKEKSKLKTTVKGKNSKKGRSGKNV